MQKDEVLKLKGLLKEAFDVFERIDELGMSVVERVAKEGNEDRKRATNSAIERTRFQGLSTSKGPKTFRPLYLKAQKQNGYYQAIWKRITSSKGSTLTRSKYVRKGKGLSYDISALRKMSTKEEREIIERMETEASMVCALWKRMTDVRRDLNTHFKQQLNFAAASGEQGLETAPRGNLLSRNSAQATETEAEPVHVNRFYRLDEEDR